jgi:serine/threonine-protein kinase RsbW
MILNKTEDLSCMREFVERTLTKARLNEADCGHIVLAVDEAVSNIIRHAYDEFARGTRTVQVHIHADAEKIEVVLKDSGRGFDPDSVPSLCIEDHIRLGRRYGLGLFLMRRVMDEVKYVFRSGAENALTMVKYIKQNEREKPGGSRGGKNGRSKAQKA